MKQREQAAQMQQEREMEAYELEKAEKAAGIRAKDAKTEKDMVETQGAAEEAEGQRLENIQKSLEMAVASDEMRGVMRQMAAQIIQEQLVDQQQQARAMNLP